MSAGPAQAAELTGQMIGPYRIDRQIGRGGMGIVYKALDSRSGREVAVKVIRPETRTPNTDRAFRREARLAASLDHPGLIKILDIATDGDPAYIVMEFAGGDPLNTLIPPTGFPLDRTLQLAIAIGEAIAAAHAANVIHRDLKPGNIMVDGEAIKILDFGLAKLLDAEGNEETTIFGGGHRMAGTIAYMAPEQARAERIDRRADIFSFGVIFSQMLTGALPFRAPNPVAMLRAIQQDEPTPVLALRPELPPSLDTLIGRALAKNPDERYGEITEAVEFLRDIAPGTGGGSHWMAGGAFSHPAREESFAIGQRPPSIGSERASIAVLSFRSLSADPEDAYTAAGVASEVISALAGVPRLRVASQQASFRLGDQDPQLAAKTLNTRYVVAGTVRRSGERLRVHVELIDAFQEMVVWSKTYDRRMTDIFEVQEEISKSIVGSIGGHMIRADTDTVYRIPTENLDAWGLVRKAYHIWNYEFSGEGLARSVGMIRRAIELDPEYTTAYSYLGLYLVQLVGFGLSEDPVESMKTALSCAEKALELAPNDPEVLNCCSLTLLQNWQYEKAVQCARRSIKAAPFDLVAWGYLALAHVCAGGENEVKEALRILEKLIADTPDHPSAAYWYNFQSAGLLRQKRFPEALEAALRSVEIQPGYVSSQALLAEAYCRNGKKDEARRVLDVILKYNPKFTIGQYQMLITPMCRSEEIVLSLSGCCKSLEDQDAVPSQTEQR